MDDTARAVLSTTRIKRHYRTAEEKRRIVEETLVPGNSVAVVARTHEINANLVFQWRKLYQAGLLGTTSAGAARARGVRLLPVRVAEEAESRPPVPVVVSPQSDSADREAEVVLGSMELTLAKAQIRITGAVDSQVLRVVLECLLA